MRTTINVDEHLMREAKRRAAASGRTLASIVEDALRQAFSGAVATQEREPFRLVTFGGEQMRPGVDLDDSAGLLELLEEDEPLGRRR